MKGLIIKDYYNLKKLLQQYAALLVFLIVISFIMKSSTYMITMVTFLIPMLAISALGYDEQSNFNKYLFTLPVNTEQIVKAKYASLLMLLAGGVIAGISSGIILTGMFKQSISTLLLTGYLVSCAALLLYSIMLPILYKVGVEKSRMLMMVIFAVPTVIIYGVYQLAIRYAAPETIENTIQFVKDYYRYLLIIPIILAAFVMFISYRISVSILKKKYF